MLEGYFDQELKLMIQHYSDKGKKKSKVKSPLESLKILGYNKKFKYYILSIYYAYKIISQNLLDAVYYHATVGLQNGTRGQPSDPGYGLLTELEHKNICNLLRNIKNSNTFLYKNTKESAPVGDFDKLAEDNIDYTAMSAKNVGESVNLDFTAIMATLKTKQSPEKTRNNPHEETKEAKKSGNKEKSPAKSGKSKTRANTNSPSKKGGKKKKAKVEEIDVDWQIPAGRTQGFNAFLPDRSTMQRLVTRAAELCKNDASEKTKKDDMEPQFMSVRPWIRLHNEDIASNPRLEGSDYIFCQKYYQPDFKLQLPNADLIGQGDSID